METFCPDMSLHEGKYMDEIVALDLFPDRDFVLSIGSSGRLVTGMQLILQALSESYRNIPFVQSAGRFDEQMRSAVTVIQQKAGLPMTGAIDISTWNMIARLYGVISKITFRAQPHES